MMKNVMKKIVMPLAAGVLLTAGAQAQEPKLAIEGQAYIISSTVAASVTPSTATTKYEWYRNDTLIAACTTATCTVPASLCKGANVAFKRKLKVTGGCAGDTEGFTNSVIVTFKCGGGHGTKFGNLCWADRNVGAAGAFTATAHEYSPFYQWNRNKAWPFNTSSWNYTYDNSSTWTVDPNPCPPSWRVPTQEEYQLLLSVGSTWADMNTRGNMFPGYFCGYNHATCRLPNSMSGCVFFPQAGYRIADGTLSYRNLNSSYWTNDVQSNPTNGPRFYTYDSLSGLGINNVNKLYAIPIRCVR